LQTDDHAPLIAALEAHRKAVEDLHVRLQVRQKAMKELHRTYVSDLLRLMTPQTKKASAPLAGCLIDWVTAFERGGLRTSILRQFGPVDVPIAHGMLQIQTANGPIELVGELEIVVHGWVTESGFYRHRESFGGHVAHYSLDKLEDADDLITEIHPELLRQFHDQVVSGKVWKNIENWVRTRTELALKDS
jgi:hypothetical protein